MNKLSSGHPKISLRYARSKIDPFGKSNKQSSSRNSQIEFSAPKICKHIFEIHMQQNYCHCRIDRHFLKIAKLSLGHLK